jgi:FixJ family two-component response regulator
MAARARELASGGDMLCTNLHRSTLAPPMQQALTTPEARSAQPAPQASVRMAGVGEPMPLVYVVDADRTARDSLGRLIQGCGWQPALFACAEAFLAQPGDLCPSCLILEAALPGLDGLGLQRRIASERAYMPIIFLSACQDLMTIVQAMKAGAMEFISKPCSDEVLVQAMRVALDRSRGLQSVASELLALQRRYAWLSKREREVMELVVAGRMNKQIGDELGISEITVKAHRGRVMRKMRADSLAALVTVAGRLRNPREALLRSTLQRRGAVA